MSKILINKTSNNGSIIDNHQQPIDLNGLNIEYTEKTDNSISELISGDTTLYFEKIENTSTEENINEFLVSYDDIKVIMTSEQLLDFYKLVKSDIPLNLLEGIIKTRVLDINNSQGVLITNKNYKINGRQTPFLNRQDFAEPHTFTTWIKPNARNFNRKTLIRNQLIFGVASDEE